MTPKEFYRGTIVMTEKKAFSSEVANALKDMGGPKCRTPEDEEALQELLASSPEAPFILDGSCGSKEIARFLQASQNTSPHGRRPVLLTINTVTPEVAAIAMDLNVTRIVVGKASAAAIEEQLRKIIDIYRSSEDLHKGLERIAAARAGDDSESESVTSIFESLVAEFPKNVRLAVDFAEHLIGEGDWRKAEVLLHPFWSMDPPYLRALSTYSRCLAKKGEVEEAIRLLQQAKLINPSNVERLVDLGKVLLQSGKSEEAEMQFDEALSKDPENHEARMGIGACKLLGDDLNEALGFLHETTNSREMASIFNTAAILAVNGRKFDHAIILYKTAMKTLDQDDKATARLLFNQGLALFKSAKPEEALTCFQKAAEVDPSFENARLNAVVLTRKESELDTLEENSSYDALVEAKAFQAG